MIGIGTDLIKISRIKSILDDTAALASFLQHTYTKKELEVIASSPTPLIRYAAHFAAKEAVFKALSIDNIPHFNWNEIEILYHDGGSPHVILHHKIKEIACAKQAENIFLSLSYDTDCAIAFAAIL